MGDFDADGAADLVVGAGFGGGPRVAVFAGPSLASGPRKLLGDFFLFEPSLRNGAFIAAGDINGDGFADIVGGGGPGGGPRVFAVSGASLIASGGTTLTPLANFFAGDVNSRGGVTVAVKDLNGDGFADIITGAGANSGAGVQAFLGNTLTPNGTPTAPTPTCPARPSASSSPRSSSSPTR